MAKISRFIKFVKLNNYHSHFAVEFFLLVVLMLTVGANLFIRANASLAKISERSLLFVYLKNHPERNEKLVQAYESVNHTVTSMSAVRQVLAATTAGADDASHDSHMPLPTQSGQALVKPNPSSSGSPSPNHDVQVYQVRGGDTVSRIAAAYGVSESTITIENKLASADSIKPGQDLVILPTSGVKHVVKDGETLEAIAKKYNVELEDVLEYNEIEIENVIQPGEEIIVPNATVKTPPTPERQQYLAKLKKPDNYQQVEVPGDYQGSGSGLIWPLPGAHRLSEKCVRRHQGIDSPCNNCQVVAASDGIVEIAGYQKNGYGNTILINHGGGLKTRYGHAWTLFVSAGERVEQGQVIMLSGSTGRSSGPHLHFEVRVNGAAKNPLSYVK